MFWTVCCLISLVVQDVTVDEAVKVNYVILDVTARLADGSLVTDLKASDFELLENKKKIDIELFQTLNFLEPADPSSKKPSDAIAQTLILLLDFSVADVDTVRETFLQLQDFLYDLKERDDLQIFIISMEKGFVTQGFTTNPELALEDLLIFEGTVLDEIDRQTLKARQHSLVQLEANLGGCFVKSLDTDRFGPTGARNQVAPCLEGAYKVYTDHQVTRNRELLRRLERVMLWLARVDGLKSLYLVSPGVSLYPGQAASNMAQGYLRSIQGKTSGGSFVNTSTVNRPGTNPGSNRDDPFLEFDSRSRQLVSFQPQSLEADFRRLAHTALANRIVIHSFGLPKSYQLDRETGTLAQSGTQLMDVHQAYRSFDKELEEGLAHLARFTGGRYARSPKLAHAVAETVSQHRFYYVLGYPLPQRGKKKFRELRLKCKREGVVLQHHLGYFPRPDATTGRKKRN